MSGGRPEPETSLLQRKNTVSGSNRHHKIGRAAGAAKREATKFKRSAHFLTGELTRLCQDCLRRADGRMLTAHEMAVTALHQKGSTRGTRSCWRTSGSESLGRLRGCWERGCGEGWVWGECAVGVAYVKKFTEGR